MKEELGMSKRLERKQVRQAAWTWMFFHHSAQNFERMQGLAFCHTLSKNLGELYKDDPKELKEALIRHMQFFNTEPQLGSMIPGITLALEEARANGEGVDTELILGTKNALMGPFAGIGDSILMGTYSPILLSIAIGLSVEGSPMGALFFVVAWLGTVIPLKYFMFMKGYDLGLDAIAVMMNQEVKDKITTALTMVGLIVIGGVASTTVAAPVQFVFTAGEMTVSIQEILNKIMPTILPMILTLSIWTLADKKGWSGNKLILAILAFAALMVGLGIM